MRIISVLNDKGGVGKTIIASLLCDTGLILRKRVLVIDLDPQATLSRGRLAMYGLIPEEPPLIAETDPSLADFLRDRGNIMNYVMAIGAHVFAPENPTKPEDFPLSVLWPGYQLPEVMENLSSVQQKEAYEAVEDWLEKCRDQNLWDYCIIDNPPSRSNLPQRLAMRSDMVVVPSLPEPNSYEATLRLIDKIRGVPMLVVPNRVYKSQIHAEYVESFQTLRVPKIIDVASAIPSSPYFIEEQAQGVPTLLFRKSNSDIKATYDMICKAMDLPGKSWLFQQISAAYEEYKPEMMRYNDKLSARYARRKRARLVPEPKL